MKYFIGFLIISIVLFISTYFLLSVWDIDLMSEQNFNRTLLSLGIIISTAFILAVIVFVPLFFKSTDTDYQSTTNGVAQKKKTN